MSNSPAPSNPVIKHIAIAGLRGIRKGLIENFAPISILVGPNGCGKSTVLDALMLGAPKEDGKYWAAALHRRPHLHDLPSWLFHDAESRDSAVLQLITTNRDDVPVIRTWKWRSADPRNVKSFPTLAWYQCPGGEELLSRMPISSNDGSAGSEFTLEGDQDAALTPVTDSRAPNIKNPTTVDAILFPARVGLVDPTSFPGRQSLVDRLSEITRRGMLDISLDVLRPLIPGFRDVRILTYLTDSGQLPGVFLQYADRALPLTTQGEGICALVRTTFDLTSPPDSLLLLEEPEAHLHPRAIMQLALVISRMSLLGVQLVIATHSLELIDAILAHHPEDRLDDVAIFKLGLKDGELSSFRFSGTEAAIARAEIEGDMR